MEHRPIRYRGKFRRIFCNCNDKWPDHPRRNKIRLDFESSLCPDCGYFPWVYPNKTDEPKKEAANAE